MTVKELIEELKKFDENLLVIYQGGDDNEEPYPTLTKYDFDSNYWDGKDFFKLPKGKEFVAL